MKTVLLFPILLSILAAVAADSESIPYDDYETIIQSALVKPKKVEKSKPWPVAVFSFIKKLLKLIMKPVKYFLRTPWREIVEDVEKYVIKQIMTPMEKIIKKIIKWGHSFQKDTDHTHKNHFIETMIPRYVAEIPYI